MSSSPLFEYGAQLNPARPLAEALRPKTLDEYLGQTSVVGEGTPLRNMIESGRLTSMIFWGPPGVGKTTLARLVAQRSNARFCSLSAVSTGIKELREMVNEAKEALQFHQQSTVVFIDEIHRYSKTQQDAILPHVEDGTIILIGATTENPSFQVIPALVSRVLVFQLGYLDRPQVETLMNRALEYLGRYTVDDEAMEYLINYANGDGRSALNLLDASAKCAPPPAADTGKSTITVELLEQLAQQGRLNYDRDGDAHYDHASAYQKSLRGSDADAALYWLGKMIAGGEDPRFIARRLIITAAEDVGLAHPMALVVANAAAEAVERIGLPEGRIPLSMATIYVAKAPKSNKTIVAIDKVLRDIQREGKSYPVPPHLRDAHYAGAKNYGHGKGYLYTHDHPDTPQDFLPEELLGTRYLDP